MPVSLDNMVCIFLLFQALQNVIPAIFCPVSCLSDGCESAFVPYSGEFELALKSNSPSQRELSEYFPNGPYFSFSAIEGSPNSQPKFVHH